MSSVLAATPKKWWQVYNGDRECRLFKVLSRDQNHEWRSTAGLAKSSKLSEKDVEAICAKYVPLGIIQQHSKDPDKWRYWERAEVKTVKKSVSQEDKDKRVEEQIKEQGSKP